MEWNKMEEKRRETVLATIAICSLSRGSECRRTPKLCSATASRTKDVKIPDPEAPGTYQPLRFTRVELKPVVPHPKPHNLQTPQEGSNSNTWITQDGDEISLFIILF